MVLPPGREPVSVPGLDASVNPKLTRAAGEVAAWIDYLLHPQDHDGPRLYRHLYGGPDRPFCRRDMHLDDRTDMLETVSILVDVATDPDAFLRPVQAIAGLRQELIDNTYDKLLDGYLTWTSAREGPREGAVGDEDVVLYFEVNSARLDFMQMREGWCGPEANAAYLYEEAFIQFQVVTENCLYKVAEHLARYWAIFDKASQDLLQLMDAFTEACAGYDTTDATPPTMSGGVLDVVSIVVDVVIAVTVKVFTDAKPTVKEVLKTAASTALNKALHQAASGHGQKHLTLDKHYHLGDTARQYLDGIEAIEREVADAITELRDHLWRELDEVRDRRRYEIRRGTGVFSEAIPHVADFKGV